MISKLELQAIINKYYLGGIVESVKWVMKDKNLNIRFMSPSKDMLGELKFKEINLHDVELAIFNTSQLNKLISITKGTLLLEVNTLNNISTHLAISDSQFDLVYALADVRLISKVAKVEEPKSYAVELDLEVEHISALIKAKNALPDIDHMIISNNINLNGDTILDFIFGNPGDYTNKITYSIPSVINTPLCLPFNCDVFKEILNANANPEMGRISISSEGLMKLEFKIGNLETVYYMVRKQDN